MECVLKTQFCLSDNVELSGRLVEYCREEVWKNKDNNSEYTAWKQHRDVQDFIKALTHGSGFSPVSKPAASHQSTWHQDPDSPSEVVRTAVLWTPRPPPPPQLKLFLSARKKKKKKPPCRNPMKSHLQDGARKS